MAIIRLAQAAGCRPFVRQGNASRGLEKKVLVPDHKRILADHLKDCFEVSKKRSCDVIQLSRSVYYYQSSKDDQAFLRSRIKEISAIRVRYGYKRIHALLQREGWQINRKRVYRLYKEEGLQLGKKKPWRYKRNKARNQRVTALEKNQCWSMDFVSDQLHSGKRVRILTIVDQFSRFCPIVDARFSYMPPA